MAALATQYYGADDDERSRVVFYMQLFHQLRTRRANFESQWEEESALAWPDYMGSFTFGRDIAPGTKRQQYQIDSSASIAAFRFASIVDWLVTPQNLMWSKVGVSDTELRKDKDVKTWLSEVTRILWAERYKAQANFVSQNAQNMMGLGVFGNMGMFIDEIDDYLEPNDRGLRYLALPVGEVYLIQDHQRRVVGFIRHFRLNAQQAKVQFKNRVVPQIETALSNNSQQPFDFLHIVRPRNHFNPFAKLGQAGKKFESVYVSIQGNCILEEGGYRTLPLAYGRYLQAPDEDYGRGPAGIALATLKGKNAVKRTFIKNTHRAGDPAYIVSDTGLIDLKVHSGAINGGMMSRDGKPLIGVLPNGEIQYTEKMMEMDDAVINSAFLVDLFKMVLDNPGTMDPRQVIEYVNERGVILFPTVGRQNSEYLGPLTDRELDILSFQRKLPTVPQAFKEAHGQFELEYTNPISLAMRGSQIAGYVRTLEFAGNAVKSGADPSMMDIFDFDASLPEMGEWNMSPGNWFSDAKKLKATRQARSKAQQQDQYIKSLPGLAAQEKAKAITAKAQTGGNIGGTLSGVPEGGMPLMPGGGGQGPQQ